MDKLQQRLSLRLPSLGRMFVAALLFILSARLDSVQGSVGKEVLDATSSSLEAGAQSTPSSDEGFSLPDSGVRFGAKHMRRMTTKKLKRVSNCLYYYHGQLGEEGEEGAKRHGKGFICGKIHAHKYIGSWHKNYRHGYGITFKKIQLLPGFCAMAHMWYMGIPIKKMKIHRKIVCHFLKMYRCPLTVKIMLNIFDLLPTPTGDGAELCDGEGAKPTPSVTHAPSERPSKGRADNITREAVIPSSVFSSSAPTGYSAKYDSPVFAILRCAIPSESYNPMIFSLTKGFNPHFQIKQSRQRTAGVSQQGATSAGNTSSFDPVDIKSPLTGDTANAKLFNLKKEEDYLFEVGIPKKSSEDYAEDFQITKGDFVITFPNTVKTVAGLLHGKDFSFNRGEARYDVKFDPIASALTFTTDKRTTISMHRAGITPFYDRSAQVITIYFSSPEHFLSLLIQHEPSKKDVPVSFDKDTPISGIAPANSTKSYWKATVKTDALGPLFQCLTEGI